MGIAYNGPPEIAGVASDAPPELTAFAGFRTESRVKIQGASRIPWCTNPEEKPQRGEE